MQYRSLGQTGLNISALSFGGSSLGGVFRSIDESDGIRAVHLALDHGVNFIDTSPYYGSTQAESVLGRALKSVDRARYYLATKVGQYGDGAFDFSATRIAQSIDESLSRLHIDHIDLIQCHDIEFTHVDQIVNETLPTLHALKSKGKIRHVGITGLPLRVLRETTRRADPTHIETVLSFCRYTLTDTALEAELPFYESRHIGVINAAPTGMGLLTHCPPPPWHPASPKMKSIAAAAAAACREKGIDLTTLAIQFAIANRRIATTLVGTASSTEMLANIHAATTPINEDHLAFAQSLLTPIRNHNFTRGLPENQDEVIS